MSNKKLTGTLIPKDNKKAKMHATFYSDKPIGGGGDSEIFDEYIDATDQQRNIALANVSNQTANSTTGKMGYKILDPTKTFASQVTAENTIYEIRDVFDLNGGSVTIPANCTLKFDGGSIKNGTVQGNNTIIQAPEYEIFKHGVSKFHGYYTDAYSHYEYKSSYNGIILTGTWNNTKVSSAWNGLDNIGTSECSYQLNNHFTLYSSGSKVIVPKNTYYVYGSVKITHSADFCDSSVVNIADFSTVEDISIPIPDNTTSTPLRSIYGFVKVIGNNRIVENLNVDGQSDKRSESYSDLGGVGITCGVAMGNNENVTLRNISISNCIESAICAGSFTNCKFENIRINNVGEHGIYHHAVSGALEFVGCNFSDWSNDDSIIIGRQGGSAAIKFAGEASDFEENYSVVFERCSFSCTNNKTRSLFYSELPPIMKFNSCYFGDNIGAYNSEGNYPIISEKMNEMVFDNCNGIPQQNVGHSKNLNLKFYNCKNAIFSFYNLQVAENCDFYLYYMTASTTTVDSPIQVADPIVIRNCTFKDKGSIITETNTFARNELRIENCEIIHLSTYERRNNPLWILSGLTKLEVNHSTITVNYGQIFALSNCDIKFTDTTFIANNEYSIIKAKSGGSENTLQVLNCSMICNSTQGCLIADYSAVSSWRIEGLKSTKINRWERTWEDSLADGESTIIPSYRYYGVDIPSTVDLSSYVEIVPVSQFDSFSFVVTNNGSTANSTITVNNGSSTKIKYRFKLNLTKYTKS